MVVFLQQTKTFWEIAPASNIITLATDGSSANWVASGNKRLIGTTGFYEI